MELFLAAAAPVSQFELEQKIHTIELEGCQSDPSPVGAPHPHAMTRSSSVMVVTLRQREGPTLLQRLTLLIL